MPRASAVLVALAWQEQALENFVKEVFHGLKRAGIGFGIVGRAPAGIVAGVRITKGMNRLAVVHHRPIHIAVAHFFLEGGNIGFRHERIIGTVQNQNLTFDIGSFIAGRAVKTAMEANKPFEVSAAARQLQGASVRARL
jgi:hypothetical protein